MVILCRNYAGLLSFDSTRTARNIQAEIDVSADSLHRSGSLPARTLNLAGSTDRFQKLIQRSRRVKSVVGSSGGFGVGLRPDRSRKARERFL